jgi:hypothetical protein
MEKDEVRMVRRVRRRQERKTSFEGDLRPTEGVSALKGLLVSSQCSCRRLNGERSEPR